MQARYHGHDMKFEISLIQFGALERMEIQRTTGIEKGHRNQGEGPLTAAT